MGSSSGDSLPVVRPANDEDLVIYQKYHSWSSLLFNNRWAVSNDVVRCPNLLAPEIDLRGAELLKKPVLRRLKLCGLRRQTTTAVLNFLRVNTSLVQLEIDTLELPWDHGFDLNNVYYNLKVLSIDYIRVVDQSGRELRRLTCFPTITFSAPNLTTVYFGRDSIDFVSFPSFQNITSLTYGYTHTVEASILTQYVALQRLNCEEYRKTDLPVIESFVNGTRGQLMRLDVSLNPMRSCSDVLPQDRLLDLQQLFFALCVARREQTMRFDLVDNCHFYGVKLNLDHWKNFDCYRFEGGLIQLHHHNFASPLNWLDSPTFPSVVTVCYMDAFYWYEKYVACSNLGQLPPPSVEHVGYWKFSQLYPNIHTVKLNTTERPNMPVEAASFLCFLRCCRALNVLEIKYSNFGGDFYKQLVSIASCAELKYLIVCERYGTLSPEIDFSHLLDSLTQLIALSTNLATREVMLSLVAKKPTRRMFEFIFWDQPIDREVMATGDRATRFWFEPTNSQNSEYKLTVYRFTIKPDGRTERVREQSGDFIYNGLFSAINPKEELTKLQLNQHAAHWLDDQ